jgi:hypothetical protein
VSVIQVNGTRGEITPMMHARYDTEFYASGFAQCLNTVVTRYGPQTRVPGTLWQGDAADDGTQTTKMLAFEFSETQVYNLEFSPGKLRFWTPEGQVYGGDSPYEILSPYLAQHIPFLHARQSGDAVYLFASGMRPRILKRLGETNWVIENYVPQDGPYLPINETSTTLSISNTTNVVPDMTSNTDPAPAQVSSVNANPNAWFVFSRAKATNTTVSGSETGYVWADLGPGNSAVMDNYFIIAGSKNAETDAMFSQWDLLASNNGSDWVTLDSRDNEKGWAGSETRYYETNNKVAYRHYKLEFSGGSGNNPDHDTTEMGGWYMHRAAFNQSPFALTASSTAGINNGTGFQMTDVGRPIRLQGSDGRWRWAEIKSRVSATVVNVVIHGQAFITGDAIQNWRLGAWSDTTGWPRTGRFYEDRLGLAGWPQDPIGLALSVNGDYDNFRVSSPLVDDDAVNIRMTGGRLDTIHWLVDVGSLIAGTAGGLRSIGSRDSNVALKHDTIRQKLETSVAASRVQPAEVETMALFIDRNMRRLYELGYSYNDDGYLAREVSVLNDHLFEQGIERVEFIDAPYKFVVALRSDGKVVFFAYDREQKIAGGTLVDWGGFVEDIMVMQGRTYPELWICVRRDGFKYIEKMAPFYNGRLPNPGRPVYAAASIDFDAGEGNKTTGLAGLTMHAGKTLGVLADGKDLGNAVVDNDGNLTLPQGFEARFIVVGQRMPWRIESLKAPVMQNPQVPGLSTKVRIAKLTADVYQSALIYGGGLKAVERLRYEGEVEIEPDAPEQLYTGELTIPVDDSWTNNGVWVMQGQSMFPATIRGVSVEVEMEP